MITEKRKMVLMMRSESTSGEFERLSPGYLVEIFVKRNNEKRWRWLTARTIISFYCNGRTVKVPESNEHTMDLSIEDT